MDNLETKTTKLIKYGNEKLSLKGVSESGTTVREVLDNISKIPEGATPEYKGEGVLRVIFIYLNEEYEYVLDKYKVPLGGSITPPQIPTLDIATFDGWNFPTEMFTNIQGDMVVGAFYYSNTGRIEIISDNNGLTLENELLIGGLHNKDNQAMQIVWGDGTTTSASNRDDWSYTKVFSNPGIHRTSILNAHGISSVSGITIKRVFLPKTTSISKMYNNQVLTDGFSFYKDMQPYSKENFIAINNYNKIIVLSENFFNVQGEFSITQFNTYSAEIISVPYTTTPIDIGVGVAHYGDIITNYGLSNLRELSNSSAHHVLKRFTTNINSIYAKDLFGNINILTNTSSADENKPQYISLVPMLYYVPDDKFDEYYNSETWKRQQKQLRKISELEDIN